MARPGAKAEAQMLERLLRDLLAHDQVQVRPHGRHLVVDLLLADGPEPVARLTKHKGDVYEAGFRNHTKRWEPLPAGGSMESTARVLVETIGPFLDPDNY